jgi:hypothetical protein
MVALEKPIVALRSEPTRHAYLSRWWQRHPAAGLLVGWATIIAAGLLIRALV